MTAALNFAFTDFSSGKIFAVREGAKQLYDSDAMFFCLARAIAEGIPLLQSDYLSRLTNSRLSQVFSGNMPVPLLQERAAILRRIGSVLSQHYQGVSSASSARAGRASMTTKGFARSAYDCFRIL